MRECKIPYIINGGWLILGERRKRHDFCEYLDDNVHDDDARARLLSSIDRRLIARCRYRAGSADAGSALFILSSLRLRGVIDGGGSFYRVR